MTLSDPLLRELKGHIIGLLSQADGNLKYNGKAFGDEDEAIFPLCHCLESIFLKGLVRYDGFAPWKADCFQWFYQAVRKYQKVIPLVFRSSFEEVLNDKKTKSYVGKARLLIRTCLQRKCLHVPVELHVKNKDFQDETLRISHFDFKFDLSNSSFLDESWQIPAVVKVEMVPCERLGLTLGFPLGFPVIVSIREHSAVAELGELVEIGDILDEINGTCLRNLYGSKIETLFKKHRAEPFRVAIVKGRDPKTGRVYLPVIKLYRILGITPPDVDMCTSHLLLQNSSRMGLGMSGDEEMLNPKMDAPLLCLDDDNGEASYNFPGDCPDLLSGATYTQCSPSLIAPQANDSIHRNNMGDTGSNSDQQPASQAAVGDFPNKLAPSLEENNIPIDKFYGEDGDHFIV